MRYLTAVMALLAAACGNSIDVCSDEVCPKEDNYCLREPAPLNAEGSLHTCLSLPDTCANSPGCDCVMPEAREEHCPSTNVGCTVTDDGVILVTCNQEQAAAEG